MYRIYKNDLIRVRAITSFLYLPYTGSTECHTPDNGNGVCIDLRICQPLRTLLETRRHVQSVKIRLQKSFCGYTDVTSPKVCCPVQSTDATTSERDESDNTTTVSSNKTGSNTVHVHTSTALPSQNECGNVSVNRDRIIGGVPSVLGTIKKKKHLQTFYTNIYLYLLICSINIII